MSLTYAQYKTALAVEMAEEETEANFLAILPTIIAYAEFRIYSELDLINVKTEAEVAMTPSTRTVGITSTTILIVENAYVVTPAATAGDAGKRNPLQRSTKEFIDFIWPTAGTTGLPQFYTMKDNVTVILAPTPDAAYKLGVYGPIRPTPLSASNTTTFLSTNLEALFMAASMIAASGYQKNFSAMGDDPKSSMSWETQYQQLKSLANLEELRRKAQSFAWQPYSPTAEPRT
jgi:hypothetical protein